MCLRVLQVVGELSRGGIETWLMSLYRQMDPEKIQFDFIVHGDKHGDYEEEVLSMGGRIFRIPRYRGINHFEYVKAWNEFCKEHPEYPIIHGHARATAAIYLKIAKKYGMIRIAHSHNTRSRGSWIDKRIKDLFQYPIRFRADYFFACSKEAGEWLFGKRICKRENFNILHYAINTQAFIYNEGLRNEMREELSLSKDSFVIGHVGNFDPQKNHTFVLDIFEAICKKNENCELVLIGGGDADLRKKMENKAKDIELESKIKFLGSRSDVYKCLNAIDLFLFPSVHEGLGIVAIEAQANGLKCVLSDVIPHEVQITDNVNFLSLEESVDIWADKILSYNNGYLRKNMQEKVKAEGYDNKDAAKKITQFYQSIYDKNKER